MVTRFTGRTVSWRPGVLVSWRPGVLPVSWRPGGRADLGRTVVAAIRSDGGRARFVATEVADDAQVAALADGAASETGRIDLWFGNAGIEGPIGPASAWTDEAVAEVHAVNVKVCFLGSGTPAHGCDQAA